MSAALPWTIDWGPASAPEGISLLPLTPMESAKSIAAIHSAFVEDGTKLVEDGSVHIIPTHEVAQYRKFSRTRETSLAPGRANNRTSEHILAGRQKWDELVLSMRTNGFLVQFPVEFRITKELKLRLHQGHHRVGVALLLQIAEIPVRFIFRD